MCDSFGQAAGGRKYTSMLEPYALEDMTSLVEGMVLAEKGGLEVELEPEGVLGIWWWKAGACKLNRVELLLDTPCPEDELCEGRLLY